MNICFRIKYNALSVVTSLFIDITSQAETKSVKQNLFFEAYAKISILCKQIICLATVIIFILRITR